MVLAILPPRADGVACAPVDAIGDGKPEIGRDLKRMRFGLACRGKQTDT